MSDSVVDKSTLSWRATVLYGLNTATYKIARGRVLEHLVRVGDTPVLVRFYEVTSEGLVLTDAAFTLFAHPDANALGAELGARWDLLEAAFEMKRQAGQLTSDLRLVYLERDYERRSVTHLRDVLHGYQQGRCFYCGELIPAGTGHVDHVTPRQFVQHDQPWNLGLVHALCNSQNSDLLPSERSIAMLAARDEHLVASNYPLKQQLTAQLGSTPEHRRRTVLRTYEDARQVMPHTWEQVRGFDPATDLLYQTVIRRLTQ